jgi:hypothetical protein
MPKFKVTAYEEIYYEGEIEAEDRDEAESEFALSLGEIHPLAKKYEYTTTEVKQIEEKNHA